MLDLPFSVQKNEEVGPPYPFPAGTAQVSDVTRWLNPAEMLDLPVSVQKNEELSPPYPFPASTAQVFVLKCSYTAV